MANYVTVFVYSSLLQMYQAKCWEVIKQFQC